MFNEKCTLHYQYGRTHDLDLQFEILHKYYYYVRLINVYSSPDYFISKIPVCHNICNLAESHRRSFSEDFNSWIHVANMYRLSINFKLAYSLQITYKYKHRYNK